MISPAKRAVVMGMDGASMEIVKHMTQRGHAPNIARLLGMGVHREMWGVLPTLTAPGWTTLSTGTWPGTHGITDFNIRQPGQPLAKTRWAINTDLCRAEYLWNTVERAGKVPIMVKWEMSWPPTIKTGVQVEGTGPGVSNYHQIAGYHFFTARDAAAMSASTDSHMVDPSVVAGDQRTDLIRLRPAENWRNLPSSAVPVLETELTIRPLARGEELMRRGEHGEPKRLFALVYGANGYSRVRVTRSRDGEDKLADLSMGMWSDWLIDTFTVDGEPLEGHYRFKLIKLSPTADELEIFVPQIWPTKGFTQPEPVAQELLEKVGPFIQNPGRDALGVLDDETYFEMLEYLHEWLAKAAIHLTSSRHWDVLFIETHASDYANHFFIANADPISGASPEMVDRCYRGMVRTWNSIDRLVGRLMDLMDGQTVMALISDHGGTPSCFAAVEANDVLAEAGLLAYFEDANGRRAIDWSRTRAANVGVVNIFVNLKGREPNGIVDPQDYEEVRRQVVDALSEYREPKSCRRPFNLVMRREDAEAVNLWGELVGDVVYALYPEFDGVHGRQLSSAQLGLGAQHATFVLAGPGVHKGVHLKKQVRQVDVAPTLAHLVGLPVPRDAEGGVVYEALEDPDWYLKRAQELEKLRSS